jgi:hypothetical protein
VIRKGDYHGRPTRILESRDLWVEVLADAGPRIVRLGRVGSPENLLAETPDAGWDTPFGRYQLFGGHRLWYAPEDPELTAVPDDGLALEEIAGGVRLTGRVEPGTGLVRSMSIELDDDAPSLRLRHELCNSSAMPIELAPWSITQLPLGGSVILPQAAARSGHDVRPNRSLVLWPYTSWADERLDLGDGALLVDAVAGGDLKIGYFNVAGWVAYSGAAGVLVRRFEPAPGRPHPDLECNVETYCGARYVELEILGPLITLGERESTELSERWEIVDAALDRSDRRRLAEVLGASA